MSSTSICALVLLACALTFSAAQTSCKGRCGGEYYRGYMCQCDYNCLAYGECCQDYESQCTTKNSCKGRCGEIFKRGRGCSCDSSCVKFKQCCSDYKNHCDEEEEISGAASATEPVETNSCHNVNDKKPKEPTPNDEMEPTSSFSEGNDSDFIPPVGPTTYLQDDPNEEKHSLPNDDFPDNGMEEPEASPVPEITSGFGLSTADLLDQISTEPTLDPNTVEISTETLIVSSQTHLDKETTPASPSSLDPTFGEAPTESTDTDDLTSSSDSGTTLPQPTTAFDHVSSQPTPPSVPQTGQSPMANNPELETVRQVQVQPEDEFFTQAQNTDPTAASSDMPEVTPTASSPPTSIPAASTLEPTLIPEATTSNPDTEINAENVATGPLLEELDAVTDHMPTSGVSVQDVTMDDTATAVTTFDSVATTPDPTKAILRPQDKPEPYKPLPDKPTLTKPNSKPETKPLDTAQTVSIDDARDYQADDSNDTNLCSGRPVSAVTTLRNGTIVVFRGHYFWFLDRNRIPGPARGITQMWGVPSPIDTAFTRCNCQGKTYIFKGGQYWRFENDVLDTGYPKLIATGFDGLRGHITAALSVPQYRSRRESVYFFKRGGSVQKYSYQFGTSPTCGRKAHYNFYTVRNRVARQAVSFLGPNVNIRTSWRGFPSTITAAVSVPNTSEPEGYKYFVFSKSKSYSVRMDGERPVVPAPTANTPPQSNIFKCPKKV